VKREEEESYAVGHLSLGYIIGKFTARILKTKINIPLIFLLSVIPDIDILIPFIEHRGPTHSIVIICLVFVPIFVIYKRKAIPYLLAIVQHPLIGDFFAGGRIQLLWPLTTNYYGIETGIKSLQNITAEWSAFIGLVIILTVSRDYLKLFCVNRTNLILLIPAFSVVLPAFIEFPVDVPPLLMPPHIFYSIILIVAILNRLMKTSRKASP